MLFITMLSELSYNSQKQFVCSTFKQCVCNHLHSLRIFFTLQYAGKNMEVRKNH